MSVGNIVVELELRDGQFHAGMMRARNDAQNMTSSFAGVEARLNNIQKGLTGTLPKLRDTAIVVSSLHAGYSLLNDTIGEFTRSLLTSNSQIERSEMLLQGLSKSIDLEGRVKDASKDIKFLFDTARNAPFALNEITNSFVKMRAVGIGDVENKIKGLTNSIANFGGDDQTLHRATVAIQQMVSKGVISMEELRQQLGEAVPNAMNMMADSMGMTMQSLIKKISEGRIKAIPAINGMMGEMELSMAGSSARMMETWSGMTSQLSTNWMLLQKQVGDAGFFDTAKGELKRLNELLQSNEALKYGQVFGDAMKDSISFIGDLNVKFEDNRDIIIGATKALLEFWAASKLVAIGSAAWSGSGAIISSIISAQRGFSSSAAAIRNPVIRSTAPMNWGLNTPMLLAGGSSINVNTAAANATGGITPAITALTGGRLIAGVTQTTTSASNLTRTLGLLRLGVTSLTSPLGILALGIGAIAAQFIDFDTEADKAKDALQGIIDKQKDLDKLSKDGLRVDGDAALKTYDDIINAEKNLETLKKSNREDAKRLSDYNGKGDYEQRKDNINSSLGGMTSNFINNLTKDSFKNAAQRTGDGLVEMIVHVGMDAVDFKNKASAVMGDINEFLKFGDKFKKVLETNVANEKIAEQAIFESRVELFDRTMSVRKSSQDKSLEIEASNRTVEYKKRKDLINKAIDDEIAANEHRIGDEKKTSEQINDMKRQAMLELHVLTNEDQIKQLSEQKGIILGALKALEDAKPSLKLILDDTDMLGKLDSDQARLILTISKLKSQLTTVANDSKKSEIQLNINKAEKELSATIAKIEELKNSIKNLKADKSITEKDIVSFSDGKGKLDATLEKLRELQKLKSDLAVGIQSSDGAEIDGSADKAKKAETQRMSNTYDRALNSLTDKVVDFAKALDPVVFNKAINTGADNTEASIKVLNKAISEGGDRSSLGLKETLKETVSLISPQLPQVKSDIDTNVDPKYLELYKKAGEKYNIDPALIQALAAVESENGKDAGLSSSGALGHMQLMPDAATDVGVTDRSDDSQSIFGGAKYLRNMMNMFENHLPSALAAYNYGPGNFSNLKGDFSKLPDETKAYIPNVINKFKQITDTTDTTNNGDNAASILSADELKKRVDAMGFASEALKNYTGQTEDLKSTEVVLKTTTEALAKSEAELNRDNTESFVSKKTIALEEEIKSQTKLGNSTKILEEELSKSKQIDLNSSIIKGNEETLAKSNEIIAEQKAEADKKSEFMKDLERSTNQSLLQSQTELEMDGAKLYELDKRNYEETLRDKLRDKKMFLDADLKMEIDKNTKSWDEARKNAIKTQQLIANIQQDFTNRIDSASRQNGTSFDKDKERLDIEKQQALYQNSLKSQDPKDRAGGESLINKKYLNDLENLKYAHRNAFQQMMGDEVNFSTVAGDAESKLMNGFIDGTAMLLTEGTANFKQFAASVMKDIGAMLVKMALLALAQKAIGMVVGSFGGNTLSGEAGSALEGGFGTMAGSAEGGLSASISNAIPSSFSALKDGGIVDVTKFAEGGISDAKESSVSEMLQGGVKKSPHIALFAEAGVPEAFIPMHDGKSIPIAVNKGSDGSIIAKALLPNGKSIPATVTESNINVEKFANGGVMSSASLSSGSVSNSTKLGDSIINSNINATSLGANNLIHELSSSISNIGKSIVESITSITLKLSDIKFTEPKYNSHIPDATSFNHIADKSLNDESTHNSVANNIKNIGGVNINISVKTDSNGNQTGKSMKDGIDDGVWSKLAENVKALVVKSIHEEKRPGGGLYNPS